MATLEHDWLEIMKKAPPHIRADLHKNENKLAELRKDFKNSTMFILSYVGVSALSASLLYLNTTFKFLSHDLSFLLALLFGVFALPTLMGLFGILYSFAHIKKKQKNLQQYLDQHHVELKNADTIEYDFERLKNTVANHIRQLSELDILQILKDKGIQSWAKDLLQKELDQRISIPVVVDCALETYEQVCQKTPILRI